MSLVVRTLDDARAAIRAVADTNRTAVTAIAEAAKLSRGVINRFTAGRDSRQTKPVDMNLGSLLRFLDAAGWEIVIQRRDTRPKRARVREAASRGDNGGS